MIEQRKSVTFTRKPEWLRRGIPADPDFARMRILLGEGGLHTVCQEARCPNSGECFSQGTAAFLILGDVCTRRCRFCAVIQGTPGPLDPDEPRRLAETAARLALDYVVVTSVTRDDLDDGGAGAFAETIRAVREKLPGARIEVLIPDFLGDEAAIGKVLAARPDVINHNIETVARLYGRVRPQADYARSLELLGRVRLADPGIAVKSGMMLGLGEEPAEVGAALGDLYDAGCRILTLGQYLQPRREALSVTHYIPPGEFDAWRERALDMGFDRVASGPFVRSSYHAEASFNAPPAEVFAKP
jgi:lipoyl synthase